MTLFRIEFASIAIASIAASPIQAQDNTQPRVYASAVIVGAKENIAINVAYDRPIAAQRPVLGGSVPFDTPWITGRGAATEINCARPFKIGTLNIPAGTYALWTLPTRDGVSLIVNRMIGLGSANYDASADVGRVALITESLSPPVDSFAIFFRNERKAPDTLTMQYDVRQSAAMHGDHFTLGLNTGSVQNLVITWDTFRWTLPVRLQEEVRK